MLLKFLELCLKLLHPQMESKQPAALNPFHTF